MDLLTEVDIAGPPLAPFGGQEEEVDGEGDDDVEEVDDEGTDDDDNAVVKLVDGKPKKRRSVNYTEVEDATLCHAWAFVGMDAVPGTDQTGKLYWQRIEDKFCKLMPRVC
jgi:hypothetical protein